MLYTVKTDKNISTIKDEMASKAKEQGFGVLKEYHFKDILKEKGFPIQKEIFVYEICNPSAAQGALNAYSAVSIYLPCRISLYEEDGKTVISMMNIDDILKTFPHNDEFVEEMQNVLVSLKKLLSSWE